MTEQEFGENYDIAPLGYSGRVKSFIQCSVCRDLLQNRPLPEKSLSCTCGNVSLDTDAGRVAIQNGELAVPLLALHKHDMGLVAQPGVQADGLEVLSGSEVPR